MATIDQRAARDVSLKRSFERKLQPKMDKILKKVARDVSATIAAQGVGGALAVGVDAVAIEATLLTHYRDVGKVFSRQLTNRLPNPVSVTGLERTMIEQNLDTIFVARASAQAQRIATTTSHNISRSVASQLAVAGVDAADNKAVGRAIGTQLSRHFTKRSVSIATVETQNSAETAKEIEAQIVIPDTAQITKEWVSRGDNKVRPAHISADGQVVAVNEPFTVMGERLMYPGDPAGSAANIVNCRCSSQVDDSAVISQRGA
jgi:hypothetical protein